MDPLKFPRDIVKNKCFHNTKPQYAVKICKDRYIFTTKPKMLQYNKI